MLQNYPNLKKLKNIENDEVGGKKRKFLDHKQYFVRKDEKSDQMIQKI